MNHLVTCQATQEAGEAVDKMVTAVEKARSQGLSDAAAVNVATTVFKLSGTRHASALREMAAYVLNDPEAVKAEIARQLIAKHGNRPTSVRVKVNGNEVNGISLYRAIESAGKV